MGQMGAWPRSRDQLFTFSDPVIFLKRLNVQNSNLACRLIVNDTKPKNKKTGQKGAWPRSRYLLFKFWDPPDISEMAKDTKLKFCMRIEGKGY